MIVANRRLVVFAVLSSLVAIGQTEIQAKPALNRGRTSSSHQHKTAAPQQQEAAQPPQPAPIPDLAPEDLLPQPPQVSYVDGRLSIDAQNATLVDICDAIGKQTGAQIDTPPDQTERFVVHLSGTPREVLASLLNGSQIGYIILASPDDPGVVRKVILTKLEPSNTPRGGPAPAAAQTAAYMSRRSPATIRAMAAAAAQSNGDEQDPPETTGSNGPNPAPLDTTIPFQPAQTGQAGSDPNAQPISAPGQFMQELYRLRQQQQQQQNQQNQQGQPAQAPPQQ